MSLLTDFLRSNIKSDARQRMVVARPKMSPAHVPEGVRLIPRKIEGSRIIIRNRRDYGNVRGFKARWPEAGLEEWENYRMVCVMKGHIDFQIGSYVVSGDQGFCLIVPPGTPIGRVQPPEVLHIVDNSCDLFTAMLHPHAVQCFFTHSDAGESLAEFRENYLFKNHRLVQLFRFLMEEVIEAEHYHERIGADLLSAFWLTLARDTEAGRYINPGPVGRPFDWLSKTEETADFKTELLHYIQAHLNQPLDVDRVARAMYLSRAQFARRVRQETGKSFVEFLTDYRMEEAKVLLRDSDWTIRTIAGFLGFQSSSYFQAVFRRVHQKSPTQYRMEIRK